MYIVVVKAATGRPVTKRSRLKKRRSSSRTDNAWLAGANELAHLYGASLPAFAIDLAPHVLEVVGDDEVFAVHDQQSPLVLIHQAVVDAYQEGTGGSGYLEQPHVGR